MTRSFLSSVALAAAVAVTAPVVRAQTPMVPTTRDFISAAAQSDHFEVLEAQTAITQTHNPRIRAFAQQMVQDHLRMSEALAQASMRSGLGPPPMGLSGDQQKLLSALQGQRGADFDHTYVKQQVLAHQEALVVEQGYAAHGADRDVRAAARSAVPIIQGHLDMAQQLRGEVGSG